MQLRAYLDQNGITPAEFAARVGSSESGVKKWLRGVRSPRHEMLERIREATAGAVTANDFHETRKREAA